MDRSASRYEPPKIDRTFLTVFPDIWLKYTTLDPTGACYSSFDAELSVAHFIFTLHASKMQRLRDKRAVFFLRHPVYPVFYHVRIAI
ncbi:hypothetical protein L596_024636 [Steinernema carpocapsae]|uniref:Uncharacterized protein n=1 Tax=Steinernema carpocapsae TaxID=34508 RepID=A0A4U5M5A8_STECR|nr:hypothetical protein L596_024636 [Steinernema carpocapsae]